MSAVPGIIPHGCLRIGKNGRYRWLKSGYILCPASDDPMGNIPSQPYACTQQPSSLSRSSRFNQPDESADWRAARQWQAVPGAVLDALGIAESDECKDPRL